MSSNMNVLATLQTSVIANVNGTKIDSTESLNNNNMMSHINEWITTFATEPTNQTEEGLVALTELAEYLKETTKTFRKVVSEKKKSDAKALKALAASEAKLARDNNSKIKKAKSDTEKELQKARTKALRKLSSFITKPKSIFSNKEDAQVEKWALTGFNKNYSPIKSSAKKATREAEKVAQELAKAERKAANAGKPKNAAYAAFCRYVKPSEEQLEESGLKKRDWNSKAWLEGYPLVEWCEGEKLGSWEAFKKSSEAPWMQ
jgi:hypothetical protein